MIGDINSGKLKITVIIIGITVIIIGWRWLKMGMACLSLDALKSAVCQDWIVELANCFVYRYKFRKAKNYFNRYWVDVIKYGWGFWSHGTLKCDVSQDWID